MSSYLMINVFCNPLRIALLSAIAVDVEAGMSSDDGTLLAGSVVERPGNYRYITYSSNLFVNKHQLSFFWPQFDELLVYSNSDSSSSMEIVVAETLDVNLQQCQHIYGIVYPLK